MASAWWKYWQIVVSFWGWCFKQSMFLWSKRNDGQRESSTENIDQALVLDVKRISRSSSMSTSSTSVPNVYVTDCDDEAEPYWQIMGELSDGYSNEDGCTGGSDLEGEGKQVLVGICAMAKKSQSKPMKEILTRLEEFEYIKILVFPEEVILKEPVEDWPIVDCLISFHSKGFPLDKAIHYANLRNPFNINNLPMQYDIQDRRRVYAILDSEGIEIPRYAVLDRDSADPKHHELVESEDHVEVNGVTFNKPFVEKPVSAEDHNIYIYYPTSAGGGSQRLFRKIGSRSSVYSPESRVRKTGSYIYEDFMPTDGTDVKVYTVGPDYAHAEARKSPALDGKVERDSEGKEIRYPVILSNAEKLISRKVCLAFKQTVCGFDLLRANGKSFVCDVNGFSFVKNSNKYYDDSAKILGNMILRELAPTLHIPWSVPFQLDDPPIVPTTFGKMMELRCVVAVIRHGDRTPKQKMKVEVRHPKFFEIFAKYDGYKHGHVKLKRPKQLQEILDTARSLLTEIQHRAAGPELEEKQGKLEQLKSVLEMYGHFSGINRKVQMKYQPRGRPRGSSSDDDRLGEPSLVLILKWGGELTPAGRIQAEELGRIFRCMYPGGQGRHLSEEDSEMLPSHGEYAGAQGLGLLRLHSTFRHDLKIYASDEGRVQMTAAAFAKGLLALEGELTPILVQMVKSANTNGLLDNDCDSSKYQNMVKTRLHELLQQDREFTREDREQINPSNALSINDALDFVKNPVKCCQHVQVLIQKLMDIVRIKKDDPKTKDAILYHGETWELMGRRWGKIEKDFCTKNKRFDISKIPDIYDCIKYDLQHNNHTLQFDHAEELYIYAKYLADIVIPQEYGLTVQEKMTIGQGICTPLLKKIRADLQRNIEESGEETVNRLNPRYSHGVSSPGRHVRTRLYFTSESHVHSLLTVLRYGGLLDVVKDEQWRRAMEYVSMVSELNYMSQIVVMLYEDPTKDPSSEERFHVELHFSPGVNCCVQKNLPPGPGFRPHSRNESSHNLETTSQCSTRIEEEDAELGVLDDDATISPQQQSNSSPPLIETEETADSTLDSPTTSRAIDMMDLDPNMMDEPYDSGFLQGSAPIPISARTVAGHEAARLGSQLAASQRQRREREASSICEPRARSYDHQRQEKPEKTADKLQYQSLDAVNKEADQRSRRFDLDDLFYERVESLATGGSQSSRNIAYKNSQSCLGAPSSSLLYASSPDLVDLPAEAVSPSVSPLGAQKRQGKASEKRSSPSGPQGAKRAEVRLEKSARSAQECSPYDDNDFWDFGESQLLEKSESYHENEAPDQEIAFQRCRRYSDDRIGSVGSEDNDSVRWNTMSQSSEASSPKDVKMPSSQKAPSSKIENPLDEVSQDPKAESLNVKDMASSSDAQASSKVKDLNSSESQETPKTREVMIARGPLTERNRVMTRSPSYLGIPVALPHSVSSPELPAPMIETILQSSGPLVTLHNKSLASPNVQSPSHTCSFDHSDRSDKIMFASCLPARQSHTLMPLALESSESKRYSRSKSALTLPTVNDARGEFATRIPEIMSTNSRPPNDRLPNNTSGSPSSFCHHREASKSTVNQRHDANTSRSGSLATQTTIPVSNSLSQSNLPRTSLTEPDNCQESNLGLEVEPPASIEPPTDNSLPTYLSDCPSSVLCQHCKPPNLTDRQSQDSPMSRPPMTTPISQSNSHNSPLTVSENYRDINVCLEVESPASIEPPTDDSPPTYVSDCPSSVLCQHCKTPNLTDRQSQDSPMSRPPMTTPISQSNIGSSPLTVPENYRDINVCPEVKSPASIKPPIDDCLSANLSVYPTSLCDHCQPPNQTNHQCQGSPTSGLSITTPVSQSNRLRPAQNVLESWEEGPISEATSDNSSPVSYSRQPATDPLQRHRIIKSLSSPNSRRSSLTIPGTEELKFNEQSHHKCSSSLPLRSHSYRRCSSSVQVPTYGASEHFLTSLSSRPSSPTVPINLDHEVLARNEDLLQHQGRIFAGRSRSLSPCPQRCLCYNCNVAVLIQESVNLSPAERLNFQDYFVRSLSHKFSNCTCYKRSLRSAEASRRASRSTSPNSTSSHEFAFPNNPGMPFGMSLPCSSGPWQHPRSRCNRTPLRDSRTHQRADENSANLSFAHFHCRDHGKRLNRRQSSPLNIGSSCTNFCRHCRPHNDLPSVPRSSLMSQNVGDDDSSKNVSADDDSSKNSLAAAENIESAEGFDQFVQELNMSDDSFLDVTNKSHNTGTVGNMDSVKGDNSSSVRYESPCKFDKTVGSTDVETDFGKDHDIRETISTSPSTLAHSGFVAGSENIVTAENQRPIDDQCAQHRNKSCRSSLSRQLSCLEVITDGPSIYPPGYPMTVDCHCNDCTTGDDDDISNLDNQSQGHEPSSPGSVLSMDFSKANQGASRRRNGLVLSRQFSCPEMVAETLGSSVLQLRKDGRNFRRSLMKQCCWEVDSESSKMLVGEGKKCFGKSRSSQQGRLSLTDKNDHQKGDNSGDRPSGRQRFRKMGFLLPRQFSCPEITTTSATHTLSHQHSRKSRTTSCSDETTYCFESQNPSHSECFSRYCHSTTDNCQKNLGARCKLGTFNCSCVSCYTSYSSENNLTNFLGHRRTHRKTYRAIYPETTYTSCYYQRYKSSASSPSSHPRLQTQRSFSSPDTRPSIIQEPDPTCTARRHRHSISGQMSYFKLLGYNVSKKLTGSANSLFSTAVISGSSSAPNLKDMVPPHASVVAAIEGFGGVPPIRPLETLHNALSLRQLDSFLDMMTSAPLFRTPASSPPKFPSPGGSIHGGNVVPNLSIGGINREYHSSDLEAVRYRKKLNKSPIYITPTPIHYKPGQDSEGNDIRNQLSPTSPNSTGWSSEPQSFLSSEPSSPAPTSAGECSMSMSLVSNDGTQPFAGPKFSTTPCLDLDFNDFCMSIDQESRGESRGSISYTDYYSNEDGLIRKSGQDLSNLRERTAREGTSAESAVDEDEEHTLTLRQTEEQRKQDVKFIFEQSRDSAPNLVKPGSSYKKIGRFRVESMEIADEDVRIKESTAATSSSSSNLSLDQIKGATTVESAAQDSRKSKGSSGTSQSRSGHKGKVIARSQSVSTPQVVSHKADVDYTSQVAGNKTGSFSTMSCADLENWKATAVSPPASTVVSPTEATLEEPILTLASSFKGTSNITVGFNVQQDKKD